MARTGGFTRDEQGNTRAVRRTPTQTWGTGATRFDPQGTDPRTLPAVHRPGGMPASYCSAKAMQIPNAMDSVFGEGATREIMDGVDAVAENRDSGETPTGGRAVPRTGAAPYTPPGAGETAPEGGGAPAAVPRGQTATYAPPGAGQPLVFREGGATYAPPGMA